MSIEITVPTLGESVTEAIIAKWYKNIGDFVEQDEPLVELETDKVTVEVNAKEAGILKAIKAAEGATVEVGAVLGQLEKGEKPNGKAEAKTEKTEIKAEKSATTTTPTPTPTSTSPSVRKIVAENNINVEDITPTGKKGNVTKGDVINYLDTKSQAPSKPTAAPQREERVKMSRLRLKIAERLKQAQDTAAMLTTFNEVDMSEVMKLRKTYQDVFEKKYGVRLGFMSFFVKAAIQALKEVPEINAEISGDEIIYKHYYDIGVAVGTEQGLVVPVIRDADQLLFSDVESTINNLAQKARNGKLGLDDLMGGTFTITNGGIYGSLMSTPILNLPQSGILGMHKIQNRPVVVGDKIEVRPMMYLALSYDHRIVDGKGAVTFLVRVKECIEDPQRLLLAI